MSTTSDTLKEEQIPSRETSGSLVSLPGSGGTATTIIEPRKGWQFVDLVELWRYRELLLFLIWRDIKVRYKQTVLGAAWAILQPLATMVVMSLFFGRLAELSSAKLPYPVFVFVGVVPWMFFSNALIAASQSLIGDQNLVTKIYFPRLIIPMGAIGAGLADFAVAFALLPFLMLAYGLPPSWSMLLLPFPLLGLVIAALGIGAMLAALTVSFRDFRYVVPFMVQLWMFATPSVYMQADQILHPRWGWVLAFNPAYGMIAGFRGAALGHPVDAYDVVVSAIVSILVLVAGALYFRRAERSFADVI